MLTTMERRRQLLLQKWVWTLVFRNEIMGYQKTVTVESKRLESAIQLGYGQLVERDYSHNEFRCIQATRGQEVTK